MAKGLAVVYGRNTVVFKALEDGNIVLGNTLGGKPGIVTIDGSLKLQLGSQADGFFLKSDADGNASWAQISKADVSGLAEELSTIRGDSDSQFAELSQDLSDEVARAQAAEAGLDTRLTTAESEIDQLQSDLTTLESEFDLLKGDFDVVNVLSNLAAIQEYLDGDEVGVGGVLSDIGDLTAYTRDLSTIIGELSSNVGGNADEISQDLSDEVARAIAAEAALSQDISDEQTRAVAAEVELSQDISDERARAEAVEAALSAAIGGNAAGAVADVLGTANEIVVENVVEGPSGKVITLGLPDNVTIASQLDVGGPAIVVGNLTTQSDLYVEGNTNLGNSDANTLGADLDAVVVNGTFQAPKLTRDQAEAKYITNADPNVDYSGHMFYLTSDDAGSDEAAFPEGRKWYFCEDGVWYASFFYTP